MKKIIYTIFCSMLVNIVWSQDLHILANTDVMALPGEVVYVESAASIDPTGSLTITSDATSSGSLIVKSQTTGKIIYKRNLKDANWHIIASPVKNQDIPTFVADNTNGVAQSPSKADKMAIGYYKNDNTPTKRWIYHAATPTGVENEETMANFLEGLGYITKRTGAGDYTFKGDMVNADHSITIPKVAGTNHYWSSIGNPYPSHIEGNDLANATANLLKNNASILKPSFVAFYMWDGSKYEAINQIDGGALKIAPGQGFMVKAKEDGQQFTFSRNLLMHPTTATTFYRGNNELSKIILNLSNGTENKTTKLFFAEGTTTGLDIGYDAGTYQDGAPTFSLDSHLMADSEGVDFSLQCLPKTVLDTELAIPLSVRAEADQTISFSINTLENIATDTAIYLEDVLKNTITKINETPYQVTLTEAENGIGRFYLRNSNHVLTTKGDGFANVSIYKIAGGILRITGLERQLNTKIQLYSIVGKEIFSKEIISQAINDIDLPSSIAAGIYLVKVSTKKGEHSKKLIIE